MITGGLKIWARRGRERRKRPDFVRSVRALEGVTAIQSIFLAANIGLHAMGKPSAMDRRGAASTKTVSYADSVSTRRIVLGLGVPTS